MDYRYEATSVQGFVQMLACNYLPHGYWFYVTGRVPINKSPEAVDAKILAKYGIALNAQRRARRKQQGIANLHYLRYQDFFVILATHGTHAYFESEAESIRDIRKAPLKFRGYSFSVRQGGYLKKEKGDEVAKVDGRYRVRVLIGNKEYSDLIAYLSELATHRTSEKLERAFWSQPYEPYAPIRKQLLRLLRTVNNKRAAMGYEKLSPECIRYRREIVKPFEKAVAIELDIGEGKTAQQISSLVGPDGLAVTRPETPSRLDFRTLVSP